MAPRDMSGTRFAVASGAAAIVMPGNSPDGFSMIRILNQNGFRIILKNLCPINLQ